MAILSGVTGPSVDPRELRVSDAERAHVMSLLEKATGRGLITLGEFSERSAIVIASKTRGELNAVLLDLPGLSIAGRSLEQAREQTAASDPFPASRPAGGSPPAQSPGYPIHRPGRRSPSGYPAGRISSARNRLRGREVPRRPRWS